MSMNWQLAHNRSLRLGPQALIMGILNVTPNSFSDGGLHASFDGALAQAKGMLAEGAAIIDVGGEWTKPNAEPVTALEEQRRVLPVVEAIAAISGAIVSIDTYREETARLAVRAGAHIVNDVWGLQREPGIAKVAADTGGRALYHAHRAREGSAGRPDRRPTRFPAAITRNRNQGRYGSSCIVLDPGFGFAKEDTIDNVELMVRFMNQGSRLSADGRHVTQAVSGKYNRARGTGSRCCNGCKFCQILRLAGADIFRVHNVAFNRDALAVADAMLTAKRAPGKPAARG